MAHFDHLIWPTLDIDSLPCRSAEVQLKVSVALGLLELGLTDFIHGGNI